MSETTLEKFVSQFDFRPDRAGCIGIEREYFLVKDGKPVSLTTNFLRLINDSAWTYELSACQVEHRTRPCADLDSLYEELASGQNHGIEIARDLGCELVACEVGPEDMPLMVYPDERYLKIVKKLPREVLIAACRVTGVHIHLGVRSMEDAIKTSNCLRKYLDRFIELGDHSNGERFRLYTTMAQNWQPPHYGSVYNFYQVAREQGFVDNPRNCWHLMRISRHGTVELRMFGMTDNVSEIIGWVRLIKSLA